MAEPRAAKPHPHRGFVPPASRRRTREIWAYVTAYAADHGYGPTLREIQDALGLASVSVVAYHVEKLVALGYLERDHGCGRGLSVVVPHAAVVVRREGGDAVSYVQSGVTTEGEVLAIRLMDIDEERCRVVLDRVTADGGMVELFDLPLEDMPLVNGLIDEATRSLRYVAVKADGYEG